MKKFIMISMIALAAAGFTACGGDAATDGSKADLKWNNQAGANVQDIKWLSDGKEDQAWDGITTDGSETAFKGISELSGTGDCLDAAGEPATIELASAGSSGYADISEGASSAVIEENADAVLVIGAAKKK